MGFPVGTYRWEAEQLDGALLSRERGCSTAQLRPRELKAFRLVTRMLHAIDVVIEPGLSLNNLTVTRSLIEIRNPAIFEKITLTLRKQFPLSVGMNGATENYLVSATHLGGGLFVFVRPGQIIVTTKKSEIPE